MLPRKFLSNTNFNSTAESSVSLSGGISITKNATVNNILVNGNIYSSNGSLFAGSVWIESTIGTVYYGTGGNTFVGINTTNPAYTLDVSGTIRATNEIITNSSINSAVLTNVSQGNTVFFGTNTITASSNNYSFTSGALNVQSGDLVLAGTRPLYFTNSGLEPPTVGTRSSGTKIVLFPLVNATRGDYSIGVETANMWFQVSNSAAGYKFYQGTHSSLVISSGGNIGINNTAPEFNLDITGSARITGGITTGTLRASGSLNANFNSNTIGNIFTTNGNVGIGTVTPNSILHLNGSSGSISGPHVWVTHTGSTMPSFQQLNFASDNTSLGFDLYFDGVGWKTSSSTTGWQMYKFSNTLRFVYSNHSAGAPATLNNAFILGSTGNVGIGNASPAFTLDVSGSGRFTAGITTGTMSANTSVSTATLLANNSTVTNSVITNASISSVIATNSVITNETVTNSVITNASISSVIATNSVITNETVTNSVITNASISSVIATNSNITNETVANLRATNSIFTNETVSNSVVTNASISSVIATNSLFTNSSIGNATISSSVLVNSTLGSAFIVNGTIGTINATNSNITNETVANLRATNSILTNETVTNSLITNASISTLNITNVTAGSTRLTGNLSVLSSSSSYTAEIGSVTTQNVPLDTFKINDGVIYKNLTTGNTLGNVKLTMTGPIACKVLATVYRSGGGSTAFGNITEFDVVWSSGAKVPIVYTYKKMEIRETSNFVEFQWYYDSVGQTMTLVGTRSATSLQNFFRFAIHGTHFTDPVLSFNETAVSGTEVYCTGLTMLTGGNIGINNSAPTSSLDVIGTVRLTNNISVPNTSITYTATTFGSLNIGSGDVVVSGSSEIMFTNTGAAIPTLGTRSTGTKIVLFPGVNSIQGDFSIGIESFNTWFQVPTSNFGYKFYQGTSANVVISTNGNVGINNTSPTSALDVTGTARVTGNISTGALNATSVSTANILAGSGSYGSLNMGYDTGGGIRFTRSDGSINTMSMYVTTATLVLSNLTGTTDTASGSIMAMGNPTSINQFNIGNTLRLHVLTTGESNSITSGALQVLGGVGIAKNVFIGGTLNAANALITNATLTNFALTSVNVSTLTAANAVLSTVTAGTLLATTNISTNNLLATNATLTNFALTSVNVSTLTAANAVLSTVTAGNTLITGNTVPTNSTLYTATSGALNITNGDLVISGANEVFFTSIGINPPTVANRTAGSKIVLFPNMSTTRGDFSIGIESDNTWFQVPTANQGFKFYQGTSANVVIGTNGSLGIGLTNPSKALHVSGDIDIGSAGRKLKTYTSAIAATTVGSMKMTVSEVPSAFKLIITSGRFASGTEFASYEEVEVAWRLATVTPIISNRKYTRTTATTTFINPTRFYHDPATQVLTIQFTRSLVNFTGGVNVMLIGDLTTDPVITVDNVTPPGTEITILDGINITNTTLGNIGLNVSDGLVGIGTTAPAFKLDILGTTRLTGTALVTGNTIPTNSTVFSASSGAFNVTNGDLVVSGANGIYFARSGGSEINPPTLANRGAGTKIVLYPSIVSTGGDFAMGVELQNTWFQVPTALQGYKFYQGTSANVVIGSNGNIGIGTTAPVTSLHLNGPTSNILTGPHIWSTHTGSTSPNFQQLNWNVDNTSLSFDMYFDGSTWRTNSTRTGWQIYKTADRINFRYSNNSAGATASQTNSLVLGSTGNVGIGTVTPEYTLDVAGTGDFSENVLLAGTQTVPGTSTNYTATTFGALNVPSGDIVIAGSSELMFTQIGAGVPTVVTRSAGTKIVLWPSVNATQGDYSIGFENGNTWFQVPTHVTGYKFYQGTGANFVISTNGNVGINNTAPTNALDVTGAIVSRAAGGVHSVSIFPVGTGGTAGVLRCQSGQLQLQLNTTPIMTLLSTGNVGIGTTAPAFDLDVQGDIRATGTITAGNIVTTLTNTTNMSATNATVTNLRSTNAVFTNDVGINTSTPARTLHVVGDVIRLDRSGTSEAAVMMNQINTAGSILHGFSLSTSAATTTNGSFAIRDIGTGGGTGPVRLAIDNVGNVGIGTSTPAATLDVVGSIGIRNSAVWDHMYMTHTNSAAILRGGGCEAGMFFEVSSATGTAFGYGNQTYTNVMCLTSTGNVGIGTTTPTVELSVVGTILGTGGITVGNTINTYSYTSGSLGVNGDVVITGGRQLFYTTSGSGPPTTTTRSAGTRIVLFPSVAAAQVDYGMGVENANMWFSSNNINNGFKFYQGTAASMVISTGGNVGIGTTSPAFDLDVTGDTRITGDIYVSGGALYPNTSISTATPFLINVFGGECTINGNLNLSGYGIFNLGGTTQGNSLLNGTGGVQASTNAYSITSGALNVSNGDVVLSGTCGIYYTQLGLGPPTTATRSVGTKMILFPGITTTQCDWAIGMETSNMWLSAPSTVAGIKFYQGTRASMMISTGGNVGINTTSPSSTLQIVGSLAKSSGTFDIPHPLTEQYPNKRLVHSFVEGPRVDLIYRGTCTLAAGTAVVNLDTDCVQELDCAMSPGTFAALATNATYSLQNHTGFSYLRGALNGTLGTLTITCSDTESTDTVYWTVFAERKDPYIKEWNRTNENGFLQTEYSV